MKGHGWPFKGRTGQDVPSNRCHKATSDEGSCAATIRLGRTFFWLLFFVRAKKSNSPVGGETPTTKCEAPKDHGCVAPKDRVRSTKKIKMDPGSSPGRRTSGAKHPTNPGRSPKKKPHQRWLSLCHSLIVALARFKV
jgi:hypothetical protein